MNWIITEEVLGPKICIPKLLRVWGGSGWKITEDFRRISVVILV
jgi:hypothetical protein